MKKLLTADVSPRIEGVQFLSRFFDFLKCRLKQRIERDCETHMLFFADEQKQDTEGLYPSAWRSDTEGGDNMPDKTPNPFIAFSIT